MSICSAHLLRSRVVLIDFARNSNCSKFFTLSSKLKLKMTSFLGSLSCKDIFSLTPISTSPCLWAQDLPSSSHFLKCVKMVKKVVPDEILLKPTFVHYLLNNKSVILLKKNHSVFALKCPSTVQLRLFSDKR